MLWQRALGLAELAAGEPAAANRHLAAAVAALRGDGLPRAGGLADRRRRDRGSARGRRRRARRGAARRLRGERRALAASRGASRSARAAAGFSSPRRASRTRPPTRSRERSTSTSGARFRSSSRGRCSCTGRCCAGSSRSARRGPRSSALPRSSTSSARRRGRHARATSSARTAARAAPDDLSETELRIARLAAAGLTNDAIAAEVFVSRKTVEANLSRAYRKLGIRSRAQLARALDAREDAAIP